MRRPDDAVHATIESRLMATQLNYNSVRASLLSVPSYREIGRHLIILLTDPVANSIDMRFSGVHINGNSLVKVRRLIQSNQILTFMVPNGDPILQGGYGIYVQEFDCLFVTTGNLGNTFFKSVIFHEIVHARLDMRGVQSRSLRDEAAAFVFQAMYLRKSGIGTTNLPAGSNVNLLSPALRIADSLLAHQPASSSDVQALQAAIPAMGIYAGAAQRIIMNNAVRH